MEETLKRRDATPLYKQLTIIIREKISSGEWAPDTMIPSENELSKMYGISRMTVRNVVTQFVSEGYLYRIQGKGTFVSDSKLELSSFQYGGLREQLEERGQTVETKLLSCDIVPADAYLAKKMQVALNTDLFRIKRVRSINNVNISYHESYVPVKLCPDLNTKKLAEDQLCHILNDDYLLTRSRMVETIESYIADSTKAEYLGIYPGFPLILLQDQIYSADNEIFEYTRVYFRGDKIKLKLSFNE